MLSTELYRLLTSQTRQLEQLCEQLPIFRHHFAYDEKLSEFRLRAAQKELFRETRSSGASHSFTRVAL